MYVTLSIFVAPSINFLSIRRPISIPFSVKLISIIKNDPLNRFVLLGDGNIAKVRFNMRTDSDQESLWVAKWRDDIASYITKQQWSSPSIGMSYHEPVPKLCRRYCWKRTILKWPRECTLSIFEYSKMFITLRLHISHCRYRQYRIEYTKTVFPSPIRAAHWHIECRSSSEIRDYGSWFWSPCDNSHIPWRWTGNCWVCRTMACIDTCLFDIKMRHYWISSFASWIK